MDSINNRQPEDNYEDLYGESSQKKIKELAEKASVCFFCTQVKNSNSFSTRPMALQKCDDEGNLWFLSADDSHKNEEIREDPSVKLLFQGSEYSDFLSVSGKASISKDQTRINEFWNPMFKTWFTEGKDDPRITVIKVEPVTGYYWDTKHNKAIGMLKRAAGAITGKTLDDSIEGRLVNG